MELPKLVKVDPLVLLKELLSYIGLQVLDTNIH